MINILKEYNLFQLSNVYSWVRLIKFVAGLEIYWNLMNTKQMFMGVSEHLWVWVASPLICSFSLEIRQTAENQ